MLGCSDLCVPFELVADPKLGLSAFLGAALCFKLIKLSRLPDLVIFQIRRHREPVP